MKRVVVPCPQRAEGCLGECVTAMLVGRKVVIVNDGQWLTVCSTCRAPRAVGEATAKTLPTLLLTGRIAHEIRARVKWNESQTRTFVRTVRG